MITRDSTELTDPPRWSHHWRTGGPIKLAQLASSGPMPLAGDTWRLAHEPSAGRARLGFLTRCQRRGVAVVWLERGARAEP
jgi:hypothetical protein